MLSQSAPALRTVATTPELQTHEGVRPKFVNTAAQTSRLSEGCAGLSRSTQRSREGLLFRFERFDHLRATRIYKKKRTGCFVRTISRLLGLELVLVLVLVLVIPLGIVTIALSLPLCMSIPRTLLCLRLRQCLCLSADRVPVVVGHFGVRASLCAITSRGSGESFQGEKEMDSR